MKHVVVAVALLALPAWVVAQATAPAVPASAASAPGNTVRPEFGKPLQAAQDLLRAGSAMAALAKVAEAEALPAPTPFEALMIQRIKATAAFGADDIAGAITAFELVLASPLLTGNERRRRRDGLVCVDAIVAVGIVDEHAQFGRHVHLHHEARQGAERFRVEFLLLLSGSVIRGQRGLARIGGKRNRIGRRLQQVPNGIADRVHRHRSDGGRSRLTKFRTQDSRVLRLAT